MQPVRGLFFAMAICLATGMGYLLYALVYLVLMGLALFLLSGSSFGNQKQNARRLKITIPEALDYEGLFDDLFQEYAHKTNLNIVRTTNMGSLYELNYDIELKSP